MHVMCAHAGDQMIPPLYMHRCLGADGKELPGVVKVDGALFMSSFQTVYRYGWRGCRLGSQGPWGESGAAEGNAFFS